MKINHIASLFTFTLLLAAASTAQAADPAGPGEFCGGFAGIQCDEGLYCKLNGSYPDAGGVCLPEHCGGIAGIACPEGYECQLEGSYPDATGQCVEA